MQNKLTIYYSGNELMDDDAMPFRLLPGLLKKFPNIDFVHHDPSENLPVNDNNNIYDLIIIDTVAGIDKVIAITDIDQLQTDSVYSPHDWDLALNLKLLVKLGKIKKFLIIGVPGVGEVDELVDSVEDIIVKYC